MLDKDDELRVAAIREMLHEVKEGHSEYSLTLDTVIWLADVARNLQVELKNTPQLHCTGEEVHFHFNVDTKQYVAHRHGHLIRPYHYNSLHHHSPTDHRRSGYRDEQIVRVQNAR